MRFISILMTLLTLMIAGCGGGGGSAGTSSGSAPAALYTTAPTTVMLASGTSVSYTINGGVAPYLATTDAGAVATASVSGANLTINGVAGGTSSVVVMDSKGTKVTVLVSVGFPGALFTTAQSSVTLASGTSNTYAVSGGTLPYTVSSNNPAAVRATVVGASLIIDTLASGSASVVVLDSKGASVSISVTVPSAGAMFTTAPSALVLATGESKAYTISGGTAPFVASSSNSSVVISATNGSAVSITGVGVGAASVVITDAKGSVVTIAVTVPAPTNSALFTTAPLNLTLAAGSASSYAISGGYPPYVATSNNTGVVTAGASGSVLSIAGISSGAATVSVTDTRGAIVSIAVTVPSPSSSALFTTAPATINIANGTTNVYTISGGTGPYIATVADQSVLRVSVNGSALSITALMGGATSVVVSDARGGVVNIQATVGSSSGFYVNAPSAVAMSVGSSLSYTISGGTSPYTVNSSDSRVALGSVVGNTVSISALKNGAAVIQVVDSTGRTWPISITADGSTAAAAAASIELLASSNTLSSAPASSVNFTVIVKDSSNRTIPSQTVTFSATSGNLQGVTPDPVTNVSGVITTVSLTPGSDASNRNITVRATAGGATQSVVIPVVGTTLTITGQGSALVGSTASYVIKAVDSGGRALSGVQLSVGSSTGRGTIATPTVTTDFSGGATVVYRADTAGTDVLTVTGLGTSASTSAITLSDVDFTFVTPTASASLPVNVAQTVKVRYTNTSNPTSVAGRVVTFSTTRGSFVSTSAVTDSNGEATAQISSATAGPVTISAQLDTLARTSQSASFVSTTPATIVLQASTNAIPPNSAGSSANRSTLLVTVRDAAQNPVKGQVVNFTAVSDPSLGYITPSSGTTDENGQTSVQFVSGALSTATNGVQLKAYLESNSAISSTTTMTVNTEALFIAIGMSNTLRTPDTSSYEKDFSVYVIDATGAPASNRTISLSVIPTSYYTGYLEFQQGVDGTFQWRYRVVSPACANEDRNFNGILDAGEDANSDGRLTPGNPLVVTPSTVTTDAFGFAKLVLRYGKNYAYWVNTRLVARAVVGGTESTQSLNYGPLEMAYAEATTQASPANRVSPFGTTADCAVGN